jgi:hypothetical protein
VTLFGVSIILIGGIINMAFIVFQLLSGLHIIRVKVKVHRTTGILLLIFAFIHGALAILVQ